MIEPVRHGRELIDEIASTAPSPGSLVVWWLGQSGFLIKSPHGLLAIDLYLSEHLTKKYEATSRPHVRMTRAPVRGGELEKVDLVLASHKHSDHLDPGTMPDLHGGLAGGGARAARVDHRPAPGNWGCRAIGWLGSMPATRWNAPAFGFTPFRRPTRGSTPTRTAVIFTWGS